MSVSGGTQQEGEVDAEAFIIRSCGELQSDKLEKVFSATLRPPSISDTFFCSKLWQTALKKKLSVIYFLCYTL